MTHTRLYRGAELVEKDFPLTELGERLAVPDSVAWVDIGHSDDGALATIGDELGLHELALEDARQRRQRPKLDRYKTHLFLTVYGVSVDDEGALTNQEVSVFVTDRALVTVHDGFDMAAVARRWDESPLNGDRVGVLLHALLDIVVDSHLVAAAALDERIESLDDVVFEERPDIRELQRHAVRLRHSLGALRRAVLPMREVLSELPRDKTLVDGELDPYYADVRDHAIHAAEWTDSLREHVIALRETQLNIQSNRLNLIMKKVTGWAAIIAIPTAITGFYGQNVPYPGSQEPWGFWMSSATIVLLSGGLYLMFKRKDWL
ncbi:magnesium transporter CorA family protein [Actinokineospora sp. NBRC 105648]|uniref:magnesium transporter CorA family protein n=1 Tax=Actinokineospora sp. NBRC 105648 TaxID=3032206 RepID=UPI0024A3AA9A|nr:magnesium transporter CorA family protein [Actinokineospora sp. NBRC 105648]GLZ41914.1 magnesium transporter CorA [Actinokineospora sp. NBRC 105648]